MKQKLFDVIDVLSRADYEITVHPTKQRNDAKYLAEKACSEGYDLIICSGGDGTLNEVICGIMNSERKLPIGYIPTGSTNDFARSIGVPTHIEQAVSNIIDGNVFKCDIGRFNQRYFTYVAAFGAFTDVAYETSQQYKNKLGHAAYIIEAMKRITGLRLYNITAKCDFGEFSGEYILGMITNASSIGGVLSANGNVMFDDGMFEVMLVKKPKNLIQAKEMMSAILNMKTDVYTEYIQSFKTSSIQITSDEEISWTLDGEFGGNENYVIIENQRQAIDFIVINNNEITENDAVEL